MESLKQIDELSLVGDMADNFKRWRQKFDIYMEASGMKGNTKVSGETKVAILLHTIGTESLEIYNTFDLDETAKKDYKLILDKFEEYFIPTANETVNRHMFFTRRQKEGESIDAYVTELKKLSQVCEFGNLKSSLIRDAIVCGIKDVKIRDRLLREPKLDLIKTINICKAAELAEKQTRQLCTLESEEKKILEVRRNKLSASKQEKQKPERREETKCSFCGYTHPPKKCPAYKKICMNCKQYNHFAKMCKKPKKKVHTIEKDNSEESDDLFVGAVNRTHGKCEWLETILVAGHQIQAKIDSGAEANVLCEQLLHKLGLKLQKSEVGLQNFDRSPLKVVGSVNTMVTFKGKSFNVTFDVVDFHTKCIIGLETSINFGLINPINVIQKNDVVGEQFKHLFEGLGELNHTYNIKLIDNSAPVCEPPRKIPFKLQEGVRMELEKMEKQGIIRKVKEPTEWVSSMVVVRKSDKSLRLCLDPQNLNKNIVRERFKLPTFEELVCQMPEAKVFSVLDVSKGFYQIKLSEESQLLTTFNAGNFGRYCYRRLPYGISSAPEVFHRTFSKMFEDLPGVQIYIDDIIIWGDSVEQHASRLQAVLQRASEGGVRFNRHKCKFGVDEVEYVGHVLSAQGIKPDPKKIEAIQSMNEPKDKKELQTVLGMITYVSKFYPNVSDVTNNLRLLLKNNVEFLWTENHSRDFEKLKNLLSTEPVLKYYDVNKPVILSVDASSKGLGAVILQDDLPVAYASKALTPNQVLWAQIEKELLAIVFGCEKFHQYIYGKEIIVESDHKPLENICRKSLNDTPLRLQRLRLRLQQYDITVKYKPGPENVQL